MAPMRMQASGRRQLFTHYARCVLLAGAGLRLNFVNFGRQ